MLTYNERILAFYSTFGKSICTYRYIWRLLVHIRSFCVVVALISFSGLEVAGYIIFETQRADFYLLYSFCSSLFIISNPSIIPLSSFTARHNYTPSERNSNLYTIFF